MYMCKLCIQCFTDLTDWEHLEGIHADTRVEHLQLTVATVNHKHDPIHCRDT